MHRRNVDARPRLPIHLNDKVLIRQTEIRDGAFHQTPHQFIHRAQKQRTEDSADLSPPLEVTLILPRFRAINCRSARKFASVAEMPPGTRGFAACAVLKKHLYWV
jgi:hypothetical protein